MSLSTVIPLRPCPECNDTGNRHVPELGGNVICACVTDRADRVFAKLGWSPFDLIRDVRDNMIGADRDLARRIVGAYRAANRREQRARAKASEAFTRKPSWWRRLRAVLGV